MNRWILALALVAGVFVHNPLEAQRTSVPPGYEPPPGMCRIWLDGVPANRQPAPTDCPTAIRRKPPNGQVIFGQRPEQRAPVQTEERRAEPDRRRDPERGAEPAVIRRGDPQRGRSEDRGRRIESRDRRNDP